MSKRRASKTPGAKVSKAAPNIVQQALQKQLVKARDDVDDARAEVIRVDNQIVELESNIRRLKRQIAGKHPTIRRPQVYEALEEQLEQLRFYSTPSNLPFISLDFLDEELAKTNREAALVDSLAKGKNLATEMVRTLERAEPYFVSADIVDLLTNSMDSFPETVTITLDDMPTPYGYVLLEKRIELPRTPHGLNFPLGAIAWGPGLLASGRNAVMFQWLGPMEDADGKLGPYSDRLHIPRNQPFGTLGWTEGYSLSQITNNFVGEHEIENFEYVDIERSTIVTKFIAALIHFMGQRFVTLGKQRAPRAVNRRYEHERKVEEAPLIRVIQLRAPEHRASENEGTGSKWSVRSIRRAHWHNYWCGGGSDRCLDPGHKESQLETRFVLATVCGPDGAPLRTSTDIYAVIR